VGFDDIDVSSWIDLTTIHQPLVESGRMGARLLLDALGREGAPPAGEHRLDLQLVTRSTTAPPRRRRGRQ
jgi:DNA-binding LacI/PurR family transcriptional regulator